MFYNKYFMADVKARKIQDFLELKQNGMSVGEYVRRFEQGCRFVPFIAEDENLKKNRFLIGLNPRVRSMVRMSAANTFSEMVDKATLVRRGSKRDFKGDTTRKRQTFKSGTSSSRAIKMSLAKKLQPERWSGEVHGLSDQHHIPQGYY
ncbi:hypothetical protein OIU85_002313 [Salix viminalis]|uniref:Retrotransposon gag domain-containing protein n=1 Tax=Salix viminalis TaxID=40686 RepID=A0A9Q0VQM5_SALVM|nr:hypothetical protein OIU85_002313 [Salix viminalis]